MTEGLLSVRNVSVRFGGIAALDDVSFEVPAETVVGLIGPNGAGKTTLFNCISSLYTPTRGSVVFNGHPVERLPAHRCAWLGIGRTFQNLALFESRSVLENVQSGGHAAMHGGILAHALGLRSTRTEEAQFRDRAWQLLSRVKLEGQADERVSNLPFGLRKRVELARALMMDPKLLLLDEPAAGLNPREVDDFMRLIQQLKDDFRLTVLLVEHHMALVMSLSDKVVVLNFGRKLAEGSPAEIREHPEVIHAYLGAPA
jgi:branched-chain amino acid transport system ATP-binding protein